jgi:intermembrane space import and assembly protein 40
VKHFLLCSPKTLGKDRIIFVTKEDHETPSNAELVADDPNDPYEEHGK